MNKEKIEIHTKDKIITIDDNNINGLNNDELIKGVIELICSKGLTPNILDLNKPKSKMTKGKWFELVETIELTQEHINQWLSEGNSIDEQDECCKTALINSCYYGHYKIAQLLIDNNADVNMQDNLGWTALTRACRKGRYEFVCLLIDRGADVNKQDKDEMTSLMWVCKRGYYEFVRLLIEKGADYKLKNIKGDNALDIAK